MADVRELDVENVENVSNVEVEVLLNHSHKKKNSLETRALTPSRWNAKYRYTWSVS